MKRLTIVLATALTCLSFQATAQTAPLQDASVAELIAGLSEPAAGTSKSFRPTNPPGPDNTCAARSGSSKNLEVEYAAEGTPQVMLGIQFEFDSDALSAKDRRFLDKLAQALNSRDLRGVRFSVAGHTDRSGDDLQNLRLSCARSLSAREYLISRGVAADRLGAYGFGSRRLLPGFGPTASEHRRVEIRRAES
jgi:outer membrane protein OmpA-like peptidoglycan-associated protein